MYPEYALESKIWLDDSQGRKSISTAVIRQSDVHGLLRGSQWVAGQQSSESLMQEIAARTQNAISTVYEGGAKDSENEGKVSKNSIDGKSENAKGQLPTCYPRLVPFFVNLKYS